MRPLKYWSAFLFLQFVLQVSWAEVSWAQLSVEPSVTISPNPVAFPDTLSQTSSAPITVTVTKGLQSPNLKITRVYSSDSASFSISNDGCTGFLLKRTAPSCTFNTSFSPDAVGHFQSAVVLTYTTNKIISFLTVEGNGVAAPAPDVELFPNALNFGDQTLGVPSTQKVTVTNSGDANLNVTGVAASGDYSETNDCEGAPVGPGDTCDIMVTFTPTSTGVRDGILTLTDDAADSPQEVPLTGEGVPVPPPPIPDAALSKGRLSFGNQEVGSTSSSQTVTLTNIGTADLHVGSVDVSGAFGIDGPGCATLTLVPGGFCNMEVSFDPVSAGAQTGSIAVNDDASDTPQMVHLSGTGFIPGPPVSSLSVMSLDFKSINVGSSSSPQDIVLTNTGGTPLAVSEVDLGGSDPHSFSEIDTCHGMTLPINGTCTLTVTFIPAGDGTLNAVLTISSNAGDSPQTITLTGIGVSPGPSPKSSGSCALGNSGSSPLLALWPGFFIPIILWGMKRRAKVQQKKINGHL